MISISDSFTSSNIAKNVTITPNRPSFTLKSSSNSMLSFNFKTDNIEDILSLTDRVSDCILCVENISALFKTSMNADFNCSILKSGDSITFDLSESTPLVTT